MANARENDFLNGEGVRYFVAKCNNMKCLQDARKSSIWAVADRENPPQPKEILSQALDEGSVVLIFSVNNCHGWHGIAAMASKPGSIPNDNHEDNLPEDQNSDHTITTWNRFQIKWQTLFLENHGEKCLPFSKTDHLTLETGDKINKVRNMQELNHSIGKELCQLIQQSCDDMNKIKEKKETEKKEQLGPVFFEPGSENDTQKIWEMLLNKVTDILGRVILACPFGSQRYNLHRIESDVDMFIVYAASTKVVLGFSPPPPTIKNRDTESSDYTIFEVHHFCELLLKGDPRCVETLFLHPSTVMYQSSEWLDLCKLGKSFLTKQCMEKYIHDATGAKGTRLLEKWITKGIATEIPVPTRVNKLFYIIIRLLQNARDVSHGVLNVYRMEHSQERQLLLEIRNGDLDFPALRNVLDSLLDETKHCLAEMNNDPMALDCNQECLQDWIVSLRYADLKETMEGQKS